MPAFAAGLALSGWVVGTGLFPVRLGEGAEG